MTQFRIITAFSLLAFAGAFLTGCGSDSVQTEAKYPTGMERSASGDDIYAKPDSVFGKDGLKIFGGRDDDDNGGNGISVNSYLWRASLDTVSFMPLASADPFGGVILTDWYTAPESPNERFKINAFILGKQLRSDGVRVRIFKQEHKGGAWRDVAAGDSTARQLEDTILTRARQLRVAQLDEE